MNTTGSAAVIHALQQEIDAAQQLLAVLAQESQALVANQVESIEQTTIAKSQLATALTERRNQRLDALRLGGYSPADASMPLWLTQQTSSTAHASWDNLLQLMSSIQEANRNNGLVLQTLLVQNQAALSALRVHKRSDTYGPNGYKTTTSSFRSILA